MTVVCNPFDNFFFIFILLYEYLMRFRQTRPQTAAYDEHTRITKNGMRVGNTLGECNVWLHIKCWNLLWLRASECVCAKCQCSTQVSKHIIQRLIWGTWFVYLFDSIHFCIAIHCSATFKPFFSPFLLSHSNKININLVHVAEIKEKSAAHTHIHNQTKRVIRCTCASRTHSYIWMHVD